MRILVFNAGSSSIKLRLLDADDAIRFSRDIGADDLEEPGALDGVVDEPGIEAVGHRVVHGGNLFSSAVLITDEILEQIMSLEELAPLHQAAAVDGINRARRAFPNLPHVACFDTAFHSDMPAAA